jgi:hypothetical protein
MGLFSAVVAVVDSSLLGNGSETPATKDPPGRRGMGALAHEAVVNYCLDYSSASHSVWAAAHARGGEAWAQVRIGQIMLATDKWR